MEEVLTRSQRKTVYRNFDCLCSSLALNCCQFSCCITDIPTIEFPCTEQTHQWMTDLIEVAPEVKLRELIIPGTHDSASYMLSMWTPFSAAGRTQNVSVYEQLLRGARYLDLRVAGGCQEDPQNVSIFHGCLNCGPLEGILQEIKRFLELHPSEFLFIEVVPEYGRMYTDEQKLHTLHMVRDTFGADTIFHGQRHTYNQLMNQWTLAQVVRGQKMNMCVMVHPRMYKFEVQDVVYLEENVLDEFGFVNSHRWMRSHWHNTRDIKMLQQWNLEEVQKYGPQEKKILNSQLILTPGVGGAWDAIKLLLGGNSLRPVSFAAALYRSEVLDVFFRDHADEAWNMVMLDYIDLTPALVCFLISLNFPSGLEILKAAAIAHLDTDTATDEEIQLAAQAGSIDVTDKVASFVKRGCVLYLTDIQKDLGLKSPAGVLTIAYKMKTKHNNNAYETSVLTVEFNAETEVLISPFCRNEENSTHVCIRPKDHPKGGCVKNGCVCTKEQAIAIGHDPILEFTTTENNECVFGIIQ